MRKVNISFLSTLFSEETTESNEKPNIEEKMRFMFCALPYITIDCLQDPKVWTIVSFISLIAASYSHTGSFKEMHTLQVCIRIVRSLLENQFSPSISTIYCHFPDHFETCYHVFGPLKSSDCFHAESQYRGLPEEATGGRAPAITIAKRRHLQSIVNCLIYPVLDMKMEKVYSVDLIPSKLIVSVFSVIYPDNK